MKESIFNKYAINQVAYYVEDLDKALKEHHEMFGSGPFFKQEPATFPGIHYRDQEIEMTLQIATGHFNNLQVEFITCLSEPNPFAEMGKYGFHHFSNWVDDVDAAMDHMAKLGIEPLYWFEFPPMKICFFDTYERWGYYLECHTPQEKMWNRYKAAADEWDGTGELIRPMSELK